RREEIAALRWSEINFDRGIISLPAQRTKNHRSHEVPISDAARAILEARSRLVGRDFVFGEGQGGFSGWSRCKERLDARLQDTIADPWRLHDLRRSAATGMADIGIAPHVIEAILNHVSGHKASVAGIYNRSTYLPEKTEALARWADHVAAAVAGHAPKIV